MENARKYLIGLRPYKVVNFCNLSIGDAALSSRSLKIPSMEYSTGKPIYEPINEPFSAVNRALVNSSFSKFLLVNDY